MPAGRARWGRREWNVRRAVLRLAWSRQNRGYPFGLVQVMTNDNEASILSASFFVMKFEVMARFLWCHLFILNVSLDNVDCDEGACQYGAEHDEETSILVMTPPLKRRGLLRTCTDGVSSHTVEAFPFSQRGGLRCSVQANGTLGIR